MSDSPGKQNHKHWQLASVIISARAGVNERVEHSGLNILLAAGFAVSNSRFRARSTEILKSGAPLFVSGIISLVRRFSPAHSEIGFSSLT